MAELSRRSGVRLAVEALVVVASILLAFAIDASWNERQRLTDERELLSAVVQEMVNNREAIRQARQARDILDARVERFLTSADDELTGQLPDSIVALVQGMAAFIRLYQPQIGAVRALLASGRMSTPEGRAIQALVEAVPTVVEGS